MTDKPKEKNVKFTTCRQCGKRSKTQFCSKKCKDAKPF